MAPKWWKQPSSSSAQSSSSASSSLTLRRNLTSLIPLSSVFYNAFLLISLLHYSTLPSLKIWSWPKIWAAEGDDSASYSSWFTLEVIIQVFTLLGSLYLFTAVLVSIIGFVGIQKKQLAITRFYRDCAIADLSFCVALALIMGYGAFFYQQLGLGVFACEELSRNPVIMRSLSIDVEDCEQWAERCLFANIIGMVVIAVIRLHAILLVSKYYKLLAQKSAQRQLPLNLTDLARRTSHGGEHSEQSKTHRHSSRRVLLLSIPESPISPGSAPSSACETPTSARTPSDEEQVIVYAPTSMTLSEARQKSGSSLREAWIGGERRRHHHHHRSHRHKKSSSSSYRLSREDTWVDSAEEDEGQIALPVYPGESLSSHPYEKA